MSFDSFKTCADSVSLLVRIDHGTDQNIKNKTLASEIDTAYIKYGTCEVHLFLVCKMYKEAITEEFVCSWQNLLWTTKTWKYSVLYCHLWKLKTAGTIFLEKSNMPSFSNSLKALKVRRCFNQLKVLPRNLLLWKFHRI